MDDKQVIVVHGEISHELGQASTISPAPKTTRSMSHYLLIASLFLGVFVEALDGTILGTAVPHITSEFNSLDDIAWYGSGYLLTITAFQPIVGRLYRFLNVKVIILSSIVVFEVGSVLSAAAPSSATFIVGRAIAGAGAAGLYQGALVVITRTFELAARPLYIGIINSTFIVSTSVGPVIGGALSDRLSWRWCFWINVPVGVVVLAFVFFLLHVPSSSSDDDLQALTLSRKIWQLLDPIGSVLIISAVVSILLALQDGGQSKPWSSPIVIGLLVAVPILLALFGLTQWKQGQNATLPFSIIKQRSIFAACFFCFFFSIPTYVYGYYLAIYFQAAKGLTATESGTRYLAIVLPQVVFLVVSGALVTVLGIYTPFIIAGTALALIGSGLIFMLDLGTPTALWAVSFLICGIGSGFATTLPYTIVQVTLKEDQVPIGNAALQFMFRLGGAIGLAVSQTVFLNDLRDSVRVLTPSISYETLITTGAYDLRRIAVGDEQYASLRQVYMRALHVTYILPLVVTGLAFVTAFAMEHKNVKKIGEKRKTESAEV